MTLKAICNKVTRQFSWVSSSQPNHSGELFDHQSINKGTVRLQHIRLSKSYSLRAVNGKIMIQQDEKELSPFKFRIRVKVNNSQCQMQLQSKGGQLSFWEVLQSESKLEQGQVLKLGKSIFSVAKIKTDITDPVSKAFNHRIACKVCLENSFTLTDPLVQSCKCAGSMAKVHLECLRKFIFKAPKNQRGQYMCNLCSSPIKTTRQTGRLFFCRNSTSKLHSQSSTYSNNDTAQSKGRQLEYSSLRTRYLSADLNTGDMTISREHGQLILKQNQIYYKDLKSKFGTIRNRGNRVHVKSGKALRLQINEYMIELRNCLSA